MHAWSFRPAWLSQHCVLPLLLTPAAAPPLPPRPSSCPWQVKMINVDNGVNVGGVDFLTVNHTVFDVTKDR